MSNMKIILEGVVGSKAYGLDTPDSDTDVKGVMLYPTEDLLTLIGIKETVNSNDPDIEHHEVRKFCKLVSKCNPTLLELLYLEGYTKLTQEGEMLLAIRDSFLNKTIFNSYGGYAIQQARKLYKKAQNGSPHYRHEKHARHCFRLLLQGKELLETGALTVRLKDPQAIFNIGLMPLDDMITLFEDMLSDFNKVQAVVPDEPDMAVINNTLLNIRRMNF